MSNFAYPPPPPPPPPDAHQSHQSHPAGGRKIPTFQNDHGNRGRRPDGRGSFQSGRGHQHRHNSQNHTPPSGGHSTGMNTHFHAPYPPTNYAQHSYPAANQQYVPQVATNWSTSQPYAYPAPVAPAPVPYANQYSASPASHPGPHGYGAVPVPNHAYTAHYGGYPTPSGQVPPVAAQTYSMPNPPPPPPPSATGAVAHSQPRARDRNGGQHQAHRENRTSDFNGDRYDHGQGQKRKREQSPNRAHGRGGHANPQPRGGGHPKRNSAVVTKPKVLTAPSVPSFGFHALPPRPPPVSSVASSGSSEVRDLKDRKKQKKRRTNQLGLTPKGDVHDVTDEELDEEAAFASSGAPQMIEYRGQTLSISTAAEVQAWIAERRKKFPTAARVAEKKALQETRKQQAEEKRKRRFEEQQKSSQPKKNEKKPSKKAKNKHKKDDEGSAPHRQQKPESTLSKEELQRKKLEKHLRKAEKLRSMLEQSDIKDEQPSGSKPEEAAQQSSSMSDSSSENSSESDSDAAPDVEPIKGRKDAAKMPHKNSPAVKEGRSSFTNVPCKYFVRDGHCRRKHCRFLHSLPQAIGGKTLIDRLKDQEDRQESLQILDIIKQLGDRGHLD